METETIDKLFLELSQVTKAQTQLERALHAMLCNALNAMRRVATDEANSAWLLRQHADIRGDLEYLRNTNGRLR